MSGYDHLNRAQAIVEEAGIDEPRFLEVVQAAIDSDDLEAEDEATACLWLGSSYRAVGKQEESVPYLERGHPAHDAPEVDRERLHAR